MNNNIIIRVGRSFISVILFAVVSFLFSPFKIIESNWWMKECVHTHIHETKYEKFFIKNNNDNFVETIDNYNYIIAKKFWVNWSIDWFFSVRFGSSSFDKQVYSFMMMMIIKYKFNNVDKPYIINNSFEWWICRPTTAKKVIQHNFHLAITCHCFDLNHFLFVDSTIHLFALFVLRYTNDLHFFLFTLIMNWLPKSKSI